MPRTLNDIITFIEHYSLDERVYMKVPRFDHPDKFHEVMWERGNDPKCWKIRMTESLNWHHCSSEDIVSLLKSGSADMRIFEKALADAVVSQAIYADYYVRQAESIVGKTQIEAAKEKTETFLESLTKIIYRKNVLSRDRAASPTLPGSKRSTRHLRIVSPEDRRQS